MSTVATKDFIAPAELSRELEQRGDVRLLDVRREGEFTRTHIAGSYHVPLDALRRHAGELSGSKARIVVVCRSDARARVAADLLRQAQVERVSVLAGGILAWRRDGLPVKVVPLTMTEVVRRVMGAAGLVMAVVAWRDNAMLSAMLAFMGARMVTGQSAMPCAVAGTCSVTPDYAATLRVVAHSPQSPVSSSAAR